MGAYMQTDRTCQHGRHSPGPVLTVCVGVNSRKVRSLQPFSKGALSHSAGTARIITLFVPGAPLKTTHLQDHA